MKDEGWNQRSRACAKLVQSNNRVEDIHHEFANIVGHVNPTIHTRRATVNNQQNKSTILQLKCHAPATRQAKYVTRDILGSVLPRFDTIR